MSCVQFSKSIHLRDEQHVFLMKSLFWLQALQVEEENCEKKR